MQAVGAQPHKRHHLARGNGVGKCMAAGIGGRSKAAASNAGGITSGGRDVLAFCPSVSRLSTTSRIASHIVIPAAL